MVNKLLLLFIVLMASCESRGKKEAASNITRPPFMNFSVNRKKGLEMGCPELRSKRYISDGQCTTPRPLNEVVCPDWCIVPYNATTPVKRFCTDGTPEKKRVKLICKDGSRRIYHVKVVKKCKCSSRRGKKHDDKA